MLFERDAEEDFLNRTRDWGNAMHSISNTVFMLRLQGCSSIGAKST